MTPEWLPAWNWNCSEYPNGMVVLASASEDLSAELKGRDLREGATRLTKNFPWLPGFNGMVYFMRTRQELRHVKVGESYSALSRWAGSPWSRELRYTPHEDRVEEGVLLCFNVPSRTVERSFHERLGPPVNIEEYGSEWFEGDQKRVIRALNDIMNCEGGRVWLNANISDIRSMFALDVELDTRLFADVGTIEHIYDRKAGIDVVSSVWCSVQFSTDGNDFLAPFYNLPDRFGNREYGNLIAELRSFAVDDFHIEPDVIEINGTLKSVSPDQYVVQSDFVRSISPAEVPDLDYSLNECEVGDGIYEIDYHVRILVIERFCQTEGGGLRRECCEQFFIPGERLPLSKQDMAAELHCNPHLTLPFSTTLVSSS
ncbi:hypothetical protein HGG71_02270 [Rhodobacteraceae bacterium R_SAG2]|nr:hypothetical protein [Rhodobacteraceae bacterium R_SAG2]